MNKKIILVIAILLIVAVVFAACKGNGDEEISESTTETTSDIVLYDPYNDSNVELMPDESEDETVNGDGDILYFGDEEDAPKEDGISWDEMVGN